MRDRMVAEEMKTNLKEGYMFVQSSSVWRPWAMKAKYFILTEECLYCYKRRGDLDSIPCDVVPLDGAAVTIDEEKRGLRKRYYIRMTSNQARKSLNLFCFMIEERNTWLTCILSALAGKYTQKGLSKITRRSGKTLSLGECEINRRHQIESLEHSRHMSISCLELTNLSVVMDPLSPTRSVVPIRKTFNFLADSPAKKVSSSSLDIAIRTDCTASLLGDHSVTLKRHQKASKSKAATFSHKRHKSMSDLLAMNGNDDSITATQHKKPKNKRLSLFTTNLNFKAISIGNLHRIK